MPDVRSWKGQKRTGGRLLATSCYCPPDMQDSTDLGSGNDVQEPTPSLPPNEEVASSNGNNGGEDEGMTPPEWLLHPAERLLIHQTSAQANQVRTQLHEN